MVRILVNLLLLLLLLLLLQALPGVRVLLYSLCPGGLLCTNEIWWLLSAVTRALCYADRLGNQHL